MLSPLQALHIQHSSGLALPDVWKSLADKDVVFRKGQIVLVCAGAGAGKSAFALTYATRAGIPTMYFSADSNQFTQITRLMALLSGRTVKQSQDDYQSQKDPAGVLGGLNVRFDFKPSPSIAEIDDTLKGFCELFGEGPDLVVIDNLQNIAAWGAEEEFLGLEDVLSGLHKLARERDVCIMVLHHVTGAYNDGDKPIPMSGIKGQVGRIPEIVLTIKREINDYSPDRLLVSTVKNRGGRADPAGGDYVSLEFVAETMSLRDAV